MQILQIEIGVWNADRPITLFGMQTPNGDGDIREFTPNSGEWVPRVTNAFGGFGDWARLWRAPNERLGEWHYLVSVPK